MHVSSALLPPSPFIDEARLLTNARLELLDARHRLTVRRSTGRVVGKRTILDYYRALDAVWIAQGVFKG